MIYLPTFSWLFIVNVAKYTIHGFFGTVFERFFMEDIGYLQHIIPKCSMGLQCFYLYIWHSFLVFSPDRFYSTPPMESRSTSDGMGLTSDYCDRIPAPYRDPMAHRNGEYGYIWNLKIPSRNRFGKYTLYIYTPQSSGQIRQKNPRWNFS